MILTNNDHQLMSLINENYSESISIYKYMNLTESEKISIGKGLVDQIYVTIAERYNAINFDMIPKSLGKIRSMREFPNLSGSIDLLINIANESKQSIPEVQVIKEALNNIVMYEDTFYTGYMKKNSPIMMTYNLLAMSVYCATSLMISVLVDYINQGVSGDARPSESVGMIIDRKYRRSQNYLMIDSLKRFNEQVKSGNFKQALEMYNRQNTQNINEAVSPATVAVKTGLVIIGVLFILKFIPIVKEMIYLFYYTRMKFSDACAIQADLINGNLETLRNRGVDNSSKMYRIQKWFADKLTVLSNKFAFTYEKGEKQAEIESKVKLTPEDIMLF